MRHEGNKRKVNYMQKITIKFEHDKNTYINTELSIYISSDISLKGEGGDFLLNFMKSAFLSQGFQRRSVDDFFSGKFDK